MSLAEPIEEQVLAACVTRLTQLPTYVTEPWYVPRFVARTYRPLDAINELPGYLVLRAPEESGAEMETLDAPGGTILASMGIELLAYGAGSAAEPTDRVLIRLLAQAERALLQPPLLGTDPEPWLEIENTRRVLDHEMEIGAPWRSLMSHLYRVRFLYTRGAP